MTTAAEGAVQTAQTETKVGSADDFDKAFGEAITALDKTDSPVTEPVAAVVPAEPIKPATAAEPVAAVVPAVVPVKSAVAAAETAVPAAETVAETAVAATAVADSVTARQLAEEAARKLADEKTQREATEKSERDAAEAREIKDPVLSAEDTTMFDSFRKDWPDVAKAVEKMVAHNAGMLEAKYARSLVAIVGKIYDDMGPLAQSIGTVEANSFRTVVLEKHSDYDTVFPQLEGWIGKQPPYLAQAYKRVYDEGNVQEVCDLVTRFKTESGVQPQQPGTSAVTAPTTPAAASVKPVTPANQAAAAALAPVTTKRTTPTKTGEDPNDFDGAFASAVAEMK